MAAAEGKLAEKDAALLDLWMKVEAFEGRIAGLEGEKEQLRLEAAE